MERIRDIISAAPTLDYFQKRANEGWVLAAIEWIKPALDSEHPTGENAQWQDVPYGQRVAPDCDHLVEEPFEMNVLLAIYEKIIAGWRPIAIANELNLRGYRMRNQGLWTPGAVFDLLPRLIELSPLLHKRPEWPPRRAKLEVIA